ncbi:conserved hypothetical protein [Theileria equi strain WA]|uniref:Uncharacterized protein n=1 Tax=Theileria equi strain WA TaxID=1537102 RepID=L1LD85_THEEQ|nr:conserved hypothetical protein [Theileria equi strain WA]EKX73215.1 conserved hypothetical protein [Theileria equi strain WA]|eukprot:XP_004832667.1 conserved hypothetical protein [Theileria equi strain WA]
MYIKMSSKSNSSGVKKASLFFVGLSLLQPLRVALNAAVFSIRRFEINEYFLSTYVNKIHNSMELACFLGVLLMNIYVLIGIPGTDAVAVAVNWLTCVMNLLLLYSYTMDGYSGNLSVFYWVLVFSALAYGLNQICVFKYAGKDVPFFIAAIPVSGILVSIYHFVFLHFFEGKGIDIDYWIVIGQIGIGAVISIVSSILWSIAFGQADCPAISTTTTTGENGKNESFGAIKNAISPMLMCAVGLGLVYAVYPGIAPYQLVVVEHAHKIDMIVMILCAFPAAIICLISELTTGGPNQKWEGGIAFWHFTWVFAIIYVMCPVLFLISLHYKTSAISRAIIGRPVVAGILTVTFVFCQSVLITIGFSGVDANSNGKVAAFNTLLALLIMNIFEFLGDGYVTAYRSYSRKEWPTDGLSNYDAVLFWLSRASINAVSSVKSSFALDIRSQFADPM